MDSCRDLFILLLCPADQYMLGHSTAVRICCFHLLLLFISLVAVLCTHKFISLSCNRWRPRCVHIAPAFVTIPNVSVNFRTLT
jgi:hypothetical protein